MTHICSIILDYLYLITNHHGASNVCNKWEIKGPLLMCDTMTNGPFVPFIPLLCYYIQVL